VQEPYSTIKDDVGGAAADKEAVARKEPLAFNTSIASAANVATALREPDDCNAITTSPDSEDVALTLPDELMLSVGLADIDADASALPVTCTDIETSPARVAAADTSPEPNTTILGFPLNEPLAETEPLPGWVKSELILMIPKLLWVLVMLPVVLRGSL